MAQIWAFDAISNGVIAVSGSSMTDSHVLGGGTNRIAWAFLLMANRTVNSIKYNNVDMTLVNSITINTVVNYHLYRILEADLPAAGTYNVVVTPNADFTGTSNGSLIVWSHSGLDQGAVEDSLDIEIASDTTYERTLTTATADACTIGALICLAPRTITNGAGQTARTTWDPGMSNNHRTRVVDALGPTPAGADSVIWTASSAAQAIVFGVVVKQYAAAAVVAPGVFKSSGGQNKFNFNKGYGSSMKVRRI